MNMLVEKSLDSKETRQKGQCSLSTKNCASRFAIDCEVCEMVEGYSNKQYKHGIMGKHLKLFFSLLEKKD